MSELKAAFLKATCFLLLSEKKRPEYRVGLDLDIGFEITYSLCPLAYK